MKAQTGNIVNCCTVMLAIVFMLQTPFVQKTFRQYIAPAASVVLSGIVSGTIQGFSYHYNNEFRPYLRSHDNKDKNEHSKYSVVIQGFE